MTSPRFLLVVSQNASWYSVPGRALFYFEIFVFAQVDEF